MLGYMTRWPRGARITLQAFMSPPASSTSTGRKASVEIRICELNGKGDQILDAPWSGQGGQTVYLRYILCTYLPNPHKRVPRLDSLGQPDSDQETLKCVPRSSTPWVVFLTFDGEPILKYRLLVYTTKRQLSPHAHDIGKNGMGPANHPIVTDTTLYRSGPP